MQNGISITNEKGIQVKTEKRKLARTTPSQKIAQQEHHATPVGLRPCEQRRCCCHHQWRAAEAAEAAGTATIWPRLGGSILPPRASWVCHLLISPCWRHRCTRRRRRRCTESPDRERKGRKIEQLTSPSDPQGSPCLHCTRQRWPVSRWYNPSRPLAALPMQTNPASPGCEYLQLSVGLTITKLFAVMVLARVITHANAAAARARSHPLDATFPH